MHARRIAMVAVLTLLLIATSSTNSAPSSLQGEATIPNYARIVWRFEIELEGTNDILSLDNELDIDVLGTVQQTPRYGVSGEAWVDGVWISSLFFDTTLSDRFFVKCTEEKAISISSYAWVEWTAPILEDTAYDGELQPPDEELPPPDEEFGMFFEYGAESGLIQPPWDSVSYGWPTKVVSTPSRGGTKSLMMKITPDGSTDKLRRAHIDEYGRSHLQKEFYWSQWIYFPSVWTNDEPPGAYGCRISGLQLWFRTPAMEASQSYRWWGVRWFVSDDRDISISWVQDGYPSSGRSETWYDSGKNAKDYINQWIQLQVYMKMSTDAGTGKVKAWLYDGTTETLVMDRTGITDPTGYSKWHNEDYYFSTYHGCQGPGGRDNGYWNLVINVYGDTDCQTEWVFYDDVVGATEKVPHK